MATLPSLFTVQFLWSRRRTPPGPVLSCHPPLPPCGQACIFFNTYELELAAADVSAACAEEGVGDAGSLAEATAPV